MSTLSIIGLVILIIFLSFIFKMIFKGIKGARLSPYSITAVLIGREYAEAERLLHKKGINLTENTGEKQARFSFKVDRMQFEGHIDFLNNECNHVRIADTVFHVSDSSFFKVPEFDQTWHKTNRNGFVECYEMTLDPRINKKLKSEVIQVVGLDDKRHFTVETFMK